MGTGLVQNIDTYCSSPPAAEPAPQASRVHSGGSGEAAKAHSGEVAKAHSGEATQAHSGEAAKAYSGEATQERSTAHSAAARASWAGASIISPWLAGGLTANAAKKTNLAEERNRRAEYLLVIYPYGEVQEKLLSEQRQFLEEFGIRITMRNKPHITVAAFQAGEAMENTLIRWIQRICGRYHCFDLTLNNYSGFPPHTIYLRVQDHQPFRQLAHQLSAIDDYIRSSGCPPVNLIGKPFLSIAGSLTEQVYSRAMSEYSRRSFHESFRVNELVLLKREHSFAACTTVNIFPLMPEALSPAP